ncbi:hypothetical protein JOM56_006978 [Amanita muscaria]
MILDSQPYLVATILQAFLYVLYLISFVHVIRRLLYEEEGWSLRSQDQVNWALLTITSLVFVFTTVDLAFEINILLTSIDDRVISQQLIIASIAIESSTLVITDAVLIIRCWLVYQKSWRAVCFPLILWLADIICMIYLIVNYTLLVFVSEVPYHQRARICLRLFCSCNFVTNFYATSAIVYRVWRVARTNRDRRSSILYRVCRIVATTGILYTCTSLTLAITTFLMPNSLGEYILCDALNFSMAGITFNLFLIRVGQLRSDVSEMNVDRGTRNASGSVVLTTVQFDIPTLTTNYTQTNATLGEK